MRHINLDLVRVTEAAAIASAAWIGSGNKEEADRAATLAMRDRFNQMDFAGRIVIGEGKKDKSFGLFEGEFVGKFAGKSDEEIFDIAVDPIDGTRPVATSAPEAMAVVAVGEKDGLFSTPDFYMNKILPVLGGLISKNKEAYTYLPNSIDEFLTTENLCKELKNAGLEAIHVKAFSINVST